MVKIKIGLTRDQTRAVQQNFFPFMLLVCEKNLKDAEHNKDIIAGTDQYLVAKLMFSIMAGIKIKIDRSLNGFANRFTFSFEEHEVVIFYQMLMSHPIDPDQVWLNNLRCYLTNTFHYHLFLGKN